MARIVVSDSSPLIALSLIDGLSWLPHLFGEVWLPEQVRKEVLPNKGARGETEIQQAIDSHWLKVWETSVDVLPEINLDEGESACISLALSYHDPVLLIMDEKAGRAVAQEYGVAAIGTAAVIGQAKQAGLIDSAWSIFEMLHQSDFRIAPAIIRTILKRVGE